MRAIDRTSDAFEFSFYDSVPPGNINYTLFKKYASDRLIVLKRIEQKVVVKHVDIPLCTDLLEHACLQLVCCQDAWFSIFFVNCESLLFKYRIESCSADALSFFHSRVFPHLRTPPSGIISPDTIYDREYSNPCKFQPSARIHFSKCSSLLARREHRLEMGYFDCDNPAVIRSFLVCEFKRVLQKRIKLLALHLFKLNDDRFIKLNREIFTNQLEKGKSEDALSKEECFPLCIKGILQKFRTNNHLKYFDRQTLCLFFKDIGLPIQTTIDFFKSNFKCSYEKFNREYLYSIRHNYGLEGRRAVYGSFTCNKLFGLANDPNSFGCPFIKNHEFVKKYVDIEELGKDAYCGCSKAGRVLAGGILPGTFTTPAEYFRLADKVNKTN